MFVIGCFNFEKMTFKNCRATCEMFSVTFCVAAIFWICFTEISCQSFDDNDASFRYKYGCPEKFQPIGKKCYYFSEATDSFHNSHYNCEGISNSTLAVFSKPREQYLLRQYLNRNSTGVGGETYWIGGSYDWRQKKWKWSASGKPIKKHSFWKSSDWKNRTDFQWYCIAIDPMKHNKWSPKRCMDQNRYICEMNATAYVAFRIDFKKYKRKVNIDRCTSGEDLTEKQRRKCNKLLGYSGYNTEKHPNEPAQMVWDNEKFSKRLGYICPQNMINLGNRCYSFSRDLETFSGAHFSCAKNNSRLALVRNKGQDDNLRIFLNGFMDDRERWIGGRYDWKSKQWKWTNGQPIKYLGFPKKIIENINQTNLEWKAIIMDPTLKNRWNYKLETEKRHYICEVKGRAVKTLRTPKKPGATVRIQLKGG